MCAKNAGTGASAAAASAGALPLRTGRNGRDISSDQADSGSGAPSGETGSGSGAPSDEAGSGSGAPSGGAAAGGHSTGRTAPSGGAPSRPCGSGADANRTGGQTEKRPAGIPRGASVPRYAVISHTTGTPPTYRQYFPMYAVPSAVLAGSSARKQYRSAERSGAFPSPMSIAFHSSSVPF